MKRANYQTPSWVTHAMLDNLSTRLGPGHWIYDPMAGAGYTVRDARRRPDVVGAIGSDISEDRGWCIFPGLSLGVDVLDHVTPNNGRLAYYLGIMPGSGWFISRVVNNLIERMDEDPDTVRAVMWLMPCHMVYSRWYQKIVARGNIMTEVRFGDPVHYFVPGSGWTGPENGLEPSARWPTVGVLVTHYENYLQRNVVNVLQSEAEPKPTDSEDMVPF